jgi:LPXTG-motif cell wall-anchored protein
MNKRILIAAAAAIGTTLALPAAPVAAQGASNCQSPYIEDCLPCEYDDSILAGSPECDPCLYPNSSTMDPSCYDDTTTTAPDETTTTVPEETTTTVPEETTTTVPEETTTTTVASTTTTTVADAESGSPTTTGVEQDDDAVRSAPVAAASPSAELPETGGNGTTAVIALGFLAAGAALVAASRRPQIS